MWGALYAVCGVVQFVAGIYFMLELPIFHLGSNIWTGAWVSWFFHDNLMDEIKREYFVVQVLSIFPVLMC